MQLRIKEIRKNSPQIFSLIFEKPKDPPAGRQGFKFYAGQYLDVNLKTMDRFKMREFTISSSPTEDYLMVTTKRGVSEFKKTLEKLQVGDVVIITHPAGTFTLDENTPAVFIAGGIGITPFRSILKYMFDQKIKTSITLIYSNSDENFLFKEELEVWKGSLNLTIHYVITSISGRLALTKLATAVPKFVNSIYYLAGSSSFVDDMEKILLDLKVDPVNIRYDRFTGYY